jgi:hypothetical protein
VGRCFCSEECIQDYFQPTVDYLHEELSKSRSESDFTDVDNLRFAHYRQLTLEDPDEVWVEINETGERCYSYVSHFRQGEERLSYVVITLAIDGVPSFVFMSFPTQDENLVEEYRRGTDLRINAEDLVELPPGMTVEGDDELGTEALATESLVAEPAAEEAGVVNFEAMYDGLRQPGDIPRDHFPKFDPFIEPSVEDPDEIWCFNDAQGNPWYTFIKHHRLSPQDEAVESDVVDEFVMIIVCEAGPTSMEVVFAFPTVDSSLIQHFRKGINSLNKAFGVGWARGSAA